MPKNRGSQGSIKEVPKAALKIELADPSDPSLRRHAADREEKHEPERVPFWSA